MAGTSISSDAKVENRRAIRAQGSARTPAGSQPYEAAPLTGGRLAPRIAAARDTIRSYQPASFTCPPPENAHRSRGTQAQSSHRGRRREPALEDCFGPALGI